MNTSHPEAMRAFARKLSLLLMLRGAAQWATVWFFIWGVVVLAARISGKVQGEWLWYGLAGFAPLAILAVLRQHARQPALVQVRANYDRLQACGGVLMAEEVADTTSWHGQLPSAAVPTLRWRGGRIMGMLTLSVIFAAVTLLLPERLTAFAGREPLKIGGLVDELKAEVQTLQEEKIVEEKKATEMQQQLARLNENSSALDPNKTWEALDHIKESNSDAAREAAEEALSKLSSLTQAEALAQALQQAAEFGGLAPETATRAAQDLAAMMLAAKLEEGLLNGAIPPELLAGLDGLNKEQMEKLLQAIKFSKGQMGKTMGRLAKLKLISAEMLGKCNKAGTCPNIDGLVAFLCENGKDCDSFCELACSYCRGGVGRGRGDAPMTWKDASSEEGAKFKEEVLPPSARLSDAQLVGVSSTAPELSGEDAAAEHGALASAAGGGGSAHSQTVLPRHKQAVQRFFKRNE